MANCNYNNHQSKIAEQIKKKHSKNSLQTLAQTLFVFISIDIKNNFCWGSEEPPTGIFM
jgi:hypothetical protein